MQHQQDDIPGGIGAQRIDSRDDAIKQLGNRFPAEKARVFRDDAIERILKGRFQLMLGNGRERATFQFRQRGDNFRRKRLSGRSQHPLGRLHRAGKTADDDAIEHQLVFGEQMPRSIGLHNALGIKRCGIRRQRFAAGVEISHAAVTHQKNTPPRGVLGNHQFTLKT